jgi:hypothetical protein
MVSGCKGELNTHSGGLGRKYSGGLEWIMTDVEEVVTGIKWICLNRWLGKADSNPGANKAG